MQYTSFAITASGATINTYVTTGVYINPFITSAAGVVLAANVVITATTTSGSPAAFKVRWSADLTLGSFSVTICGQSFNQSLVNQPGVFDCYFDGTNWTVYYTPDAAELPQPNQSVNNSVVPASGTVTLNAGVDSFYQRLIGPRTLVAALNYTANTAGVPAGTRFEIQIDGNITTAGNPFTVFGQTINSIDALAGGVSVHAILDENGGSPVWRSYQTWRVFSADAAGKVLSRVGTQVLFDYLTVDSFQESKELFKPMVQLNQIPSAQVLTSHATAVEIVSTTNGLPVPIGFLFGMSSGGSAYASHTDIGIRYVGSGDDIASFTGGLAISGTDDYTYFLPVEVPSSGAIAGFGNAIELYTKVNNPTAGTRDILIKPIFAKVPGA